MRYILHVGIGFHCLCRFWSRFHKADDIGNDIATSYHDHTLFDYKRLLMFAIRKLRNVLNTRCTDDAVVPDGATRSSYMDVPVNGMIGGVRDYSENHWHEDSRPGW